METRYSPRVVSEPLAGSRIQNVVHADGYAPNRVVFYSVIGNELRRDFSELSAVAALTFGISSCIDLLYDRARSSSSLQSVNVGTLPRTTAFYAR